MPVYAGSTTRIKIPIVDTVDGQGYDPGTLRLTLISPQNEITTYTYGVDAEIQRDAAGQYHADVVLRAPGLWRGKIEALGSIDGAVPFSVEVLDQGNTF